MPNLKPIWPVLPIGVFRRFRAAACVQPGASPNGYSIFATFIIGLPIFVKMEEQLIHMAADSLAPHTLRLSLGGYYAL